MKTLTNDQKDALKALNWDPGKWFDPGPLESSRQPLSDLFYAGLCERRLSPDNHWSYQYRIIKCQKNHTSQ